MRTLQILCFLFALIPAAILAHDVYAWYESQQKNQNLPFTFSDLGFLWITYGEETHDMALEEVGADKWNESVKPILRMPAAIVTAIPAVLLCGALFILWLFGNWPFNKIKIPKKHRSSTFAATSHKEKSFSYKRK